MSNKTIQMTENLYKYLLSVSVKEPKILEELRNETAGHPYVIMQISPEQGQFMAFLIRLTGAKNVLEIGVFTGYSSLAMALALPTDGKLIACDVNKEWTEIAKKYWDKANVQNKIKLHIAPALKTMSKLLSDGYSETFDFVFIDADKVNYDNYYEQSLKLARPGGIIAFDNVLWGAKVIDKTINDEDTIAIRKINEKLLNDDRIHLTMLPIADGLTLVLKK